MSEENWGSQNGTAGRRAQTGLTPPWANVVSNRPNRNGAPISRPGRFAHLNPENEIGHAELPPDPV